LYIVQNVDAWKHALHNAVVVIIGSKAQDEQEMVRIHGRLCCACTR
jgi:hypothetical protein